MKICLVTAFRNNIKTKTMNNVNSPNGQGGFQSGSFRVCDCAVPEPRMKCSENGNTSYCAKCSRSCRVSNTKEIEIYGVIDFLTTPLVIGGFYIGRKESTEEFFKDVEHTMQFYDKGLLKDFVEYNPLRTNKVKKEAVNDKIHYDGKGRWETESFRVNSRKIIENLKATRIHFLDTPAGRKWENIVAWRIAQKENKKK